MDRDWARLPAHLLDSIVQRLELLSDYLRFSAVCMLWYCVAKENKTHHVKLEVELFSSRPMLLISADIEDMWRVHNVLDNKVSTLQLKLPNQRLMGCSKGWLLTMEENFSVTLMNPFSRVKGMRNKENSIIRLPVLDHPENERMRKFWAKNRGRYVIKGTMSADPISDAGNCTIMVIYQCPMKCLWNLSSIAFLRLGKDASWTYIDNRTFMVDVIFSDDKYLGPTFFFIDTKGRLFGNDARANTTDAPSYISEHQDNGATYKFLRYLVDSNSEHDLLLIERGFEYDYETLIRTTTEFKVFEFNREESKWTEKKALGDDTSIFVGDNNTISVVASKFSGCEPNCIYFVRDIDAIASDFRGLGPGDYGMYNFQNESFSRGPFSTDVQNLMKKTKVSPLWLG